jgi:8-oxo-dGTP diphosphatase
MGEQSGGENVGREYPLTPTVGVGAVVVRDDHVLLVQRGNEPNRGQWSIPGGVLELGETLAQAAEREVLEECNIEVKAGTTLSSDELIVRDKQGRVHYHYVLIDLLAHWNCGEPVAGSDALAARWTTEEEWAHLPLVPRIIPVLRSALRTSRPHTRVG